MLASELHAIVQKKVPAGDTAANVSLLRNSDDSREPRQDGRVFQGANIQEERPEELAGPDLCACRRGLEMVGSTQGCD